MPSDKRTVILVNNNGMGKAEASLSHKLTQTYFGLLDLEDRLPASVCFYAEGVKLVVSGSPILEELCALRERGVRLLACGTCLNHYALADDVAAAEVGSMKDIIEQHWLADKVITL